MLNGLKYAYVSDVPCTFLNLTPSSRQSFTYSHIYCYRVNYTLRLLEMHFALVVKRAAASFAPTAPYLSLNGCISKRHSSDLSELKAEMIARRFPVIRDVLTAVPTRLLNATLADFLPSDSYRHTHALPDGYHLVHFPPPTRLSELLPDGTDPMQSPGGLFTRRMWAGGDISIGNRRKFDNSPFHCVERIIDVYVHGLEEDQKIFVKIERSVFPGDGPGASHDETGRWRGGLLKEIRSLVFMRSDRPKVPVDASNTPNKVLKTAQSPDYSHHLVPTPALLFRFSALTFNAHAIHLDKQYCREVEGHRNLLVHGPLSLVLILRFLNRCLAKENRARADGKHEDIYAIQYRNVAPLYAEEDMRICIKRKDQDDLHGIWDVWIEGRDGGYAVKGTVRTRFREGDVRANDARANDVREDVREDDVRANVVFEDEVNYQVHNSG